LGQEVTLGAFFQKILRDDLPTQAAALAYCASLAIAPIVLLALSLMSLIGLDLHQELIRQVQAHIGGKAALAVTSVIDAAQNSPMLQSSGRLVGIVTLLISASVVVAQLHSTLNIIFGPAKYASQIKAYLVQRGLSILVVLALILLTLISLFASAYLQAMTDPPVEWWGTALNLTFTFVTFALLFTLMLRLIPDCPPSSKVAAAAASATALLFMLGKEPLAAFIARTALADAYGAAGSLILFLLWVYYTSVVIYLGAEFSNYLENRVKERSTKPLAKGEHAWSL